MFVRWTSTDSGIVDGRVEEILVGKPLDVLLGEPLDVLEGGALEHRGVYLRARRTKPHGDLRTSLKTASSLRLSTAKLSKTWRKNCSVRWRGG